MNPLATFGGGFQTSSASDTGAANAGATITTGPFGPRVQIPTWVWIAGAAAVGLWLIRRR